jgi:hypothetical protein
MAFVSIGDILDKAAEFEKGLESYYIGIRDNTSNEGVRLLTYYLSRHRLHQKEAFDSIKKDELLRIKKVKLKYDIVFDMEKELHPLEKSVTEVTGRDLLEAAVEYNQKLIELYEKIQKQPLLEEANSLIECLISIEKKDIVMLKKTMATDYY